MLNSLFLKIPSDLLLKTSHWASKSGVIKQKLHLRTIYPLQSLVIPTSFAPTPVQENTLNAQGALRCSSPFIVLCPSDLSSVKEGQTKENTKLTLKYMKQLFYLLQCIFSTLKIETVKSFCLEQPKIQL